MCRNNMFWTALRGGEQRGQGAQSPPPNLYLHLTTKSPLFLVAPFRALETLSYWFAYFISDVPQYHVGLHEARALQTSRQVPLRLLRRVHVFQPLLLFGGQRHLASQPGR